MIDALPWRATGRVHPARPVDLDRMPLALGGRPRKRWRYVGVFGERLMLCAGVVQIGPVGQTFWAVWDRERRALRERTRPWLGRGRRPVRLPRDRVEVDERAVTVRLRMDGGGTPVETVSGTGSDGWIWTRKQGAVRFDGTVVLDGETVVLDALGCVDESAGFHPRRTAWEWSAGIGELEDGRTAGWNLVAGIHDAPVASERTIWLDGAPVEAPPVTFAPDLTAVRFARDGELRFAEESRRARHDALLVARSEYVQPFGTFTGTLPGDLVLRRGRGVMERHAALW